MQYSKKISVGNFLEKGKDFKEGDILEVANEGKQVQGNFGLQDLFLIKTTDDKEGNVGFNQTSINAMIDAYGADSINWIGKKVKVWKLVQNIDSKFKDCYYFSHPDAELTEEGFIMPVSEKNKLTIVEDKPKEKEGDEIKVEDIPL